MTANDAHVNGTSPLPYRNGTNGASTPTTPNGELEEKREERIIVGVDFGTTYSGYYSYPSYE